MSYKKITVIFTIAFVIIALLYDGYVVLMEGREASISHLIITMSYEMPLIPFSMGILCGHFFWRMRATKDTLKDIDK